MYLLGTCLLSTSCDYTFHPDAVGFSASEYGQGGLPILVDGVRCMGDEGELLNCSVGPFGVHNCDHTMEVGVACSPASKFNCVCPITAIQMAIFHDFP
jgi:hypothetical protein